MKMFNEMSLVSIRKQLIKVGVEMTDEQFYSLTHSELKTIYRKSKKAYKLYTQGDAIINKKKAPTPAVPMPMPTTPATIADKKVEKITKGA